MLSREGLEAQLLSYKLAMAPPHAPRGRKWIFASGRVVVSFKGGSSLLEAEGAVASGADVPVGHGHKELREPRPLEDVRSEGHHRGRLCYGREAWLLEKERRFVGEAGWIECSGHA